MMSSHARADWPMRAHPRPASCCRIPHLSLRFPHIPQPLHYTMASLQALKGFGAVCPFLHRVSPVGLRALSSSAAVAGHSRLSLLAATECPMMRVALANRRELTTSVPAPAPKPAPVAVAPAQQSIRGYASIAEQQAESAKLQRASAQDILARATAVSHATAAAQAGIDVPQLDPLNGAPETGRPTCALGFAKHDVTSARPGYDYEHFYQAELDKKHKDKSYRVSRAHAPTQLT